MRTLMTTLLRRWYLLVPGLALSLAMVFVAMDRVPPRYELQANVVLLPPKDLLEEGANPYLALAGLDQVVDVLVRALGSEAKRELEARTPGTYTLTPDGTTSGPVILVTAAGASQPDAEQTLTTVLEEIPPTLARLQGDVNVSQDNQVLSRVLSQDLTPTTVVTPTVRAALVAGGGSLVVTLMIVGALDGWLEQRRRKPRHPSARSPEPDPAVLEGQSQESGVIWPAETAESAESAEIVRDRR